MKVALYAAGLIIVSMAWALPQHSQLHWWLKSIIVAIYVSSLFVTIATLLRPSKGFELRRPEGS